MKHLISIFAVALVACGDTEPAEEASRKAATVDPVPAGPLADSPVPPSPTPPDDGTLGSDRVAQGSWSGKTERGVPMALFGQPQTEAAFSVRCEDDTLVFGRSAIVTEGEAAMRLMAGGTTRRLAARAQEDPLPQVTASLPASDPFAGTLARTTEPIAVAIGDGGETFRMPSSPVLRGVVADCMAGG